MVFKQLLSAKGKRGIVLAVLFILLAGSGYVLFLLNQSTHVLPDQAVKKYYLKTGCEVITKKLSARRLVIRQYRADFLIRYRVNQVYYRQWVSGNGLDESYFSDLSDQEDILSRYSVGGEYVCFYHPLNPDKAVLVPRHHWGSLFPVIVVSIFTLIILYAFLKNLFILSRLMMVDARAALARKQKHRRRN